MRRVTVAVARDMSRAVEVVMGAVLIAIPGKLAEASAAQLGVLFGILADKQAGLSGVGQRLDDGATLPDAERLARLAAIFDGARARGGGSAARPVTGAGRIPFCPHSPHPKQAEFLALDCLEALFGGAAGGGKSDALLMAALQWVQRPNYKALLLRRTLSELNLPGALMERARRWLLGSGAVWRELTKTWRFPSGATLTFGYVETERDLGRYQGSEFDFIGFDELTTFLERQYTFLFSRLRRSAGSDIPPRVRGATNPGRWGTSG